MSLIGNLVWLVLGGVIMAILWAAAGLLLCITIIGIPFGLQCFKFADFVLWPFGRTVEIGNFGAGGVVWQRSLDSPPGLGTLSFSPGCGRHFLFDVFRHPLWFAAFETGEVSYFAFR